MTLMTLMTPEKCQRIRIRLRKFLRRWSIRKHSIPDTRFAREGAAWIHTDSMNVFI
jgi:hypothetical protein